MTRAGKKSGACGCEAGAGAANGLQQIGTRAILPACRCCRQAVPGAALHAAALVVLVACGRGPPELASLFIRARSPLFPPAPHRPFCSGAAGTEEEETVRGAAGAGGEQHPTRQRAAGGCCAPGSASWCCLLGLPAARWRAVASAWQRHLAAYRVPAFVPACPPAGQPGEPARDSRDGGCAAHGRARGQGDDAGALRRSGGVGWSSSWRRSSGRALQRCGMPLFPLAADTIPGCGRLLHSRSLGSLHPHACMQ